MFKAIDDFEKQALSGASFNTIDLVCGKKIKVYEIVSVHELIQFIGYAKYINKSEGNVYFRGQTDIYNGTMIPSLFRGVKNIPLVESKYNNSINSIIRDNKNFKLFERPVLEPLIQHYGVKTPWIDLVDNLWVALWFALHEAKSLTIKNREYVYYYDSRKAYGYIVLMASDAKKDIKPYGVSVGNNTTVVDLRKATPSFFLRPHAQHAYMIKKNGEYTSDYSDLIVGIVKIPALVGLPWIGNNALLNLNSLFPSPHFDTGYQYLLKYYPETKSTANYGSIQILSD